MVKTAISHFSGLRWQHATVIVCFTPLLGCSMMQTAYQTPAVTVPARFSQTDTTASAQSPTDRWWTQFKDPQLTTLIDEALQSNNDLAAAAIKVRRAQLTAGIASDNLLPQLTGNINTSKSRNLSGDRNITGNSNANLSVSYELDLWSRLASQENAAQWEAQATERDLESARLSLITTTAGLYWNALYLRQNIAHAQDSITFAEKTLSLVKVQYEAGEVSGLELLEARQNLAAQHASALQLQQQQIENDNALAILFNGPPRAWPDLPKQLPDEPLPALTAEVPATVLARRPDLRAAELRLRSTLANADASRASLYPTFSLTGSLATRSISLLNVLQNPVGTLGLGLTLPFLQWNKMELNNKISQADYDAAVVNFRQALYTALSEVENALAARKHYAEEARLRQENLKTAQRLEQLYDIRYRAGAVPLRDFLNAQNNRRSAEIQSAETQKQALNNVMTLYKALGGPG